MKKGKIILCVIAALIVSFAAIKLAKKLYYKLKPLETNVYSESTVEYDGESIYDTKPVSDAYLSGDTSALSEMDKKIYDTAVKVIDGIITDDMTDYEKELAVHDYIVTTTAYDEGNLDAINSTDKNSDNPYGLLINHKAICKGYATTFKMFMDMFEIPNKLITSKNAYGGYHGWNMVELDGEWYYVDVTWDDPTPDVKDRPALHKYFNVTEEFLKTNKHEWVTDDLPDADSDKYSYDKMTGKSTEESAYEVQTMY